MRGRHDCLMCSGRLDHLYFFEYLSPFFFCQLNVLFPFLIQYYHILLIITVVRLGGDKLVSCFFDCLSQGISHGM